MTEPHTVWVESAYRPPAMGRVRNPPENPAMSTREEVLDYVKRGYNHIDLIANTMGVSRAFVFRVLDKLVADGLVTKVKRRNARGQQAEYIPAC